jgi:hypothetical protein
MSINIFRSVRLRRIGFDKQQGCKFRERTGENERSKRYENPPEP